MSQNGSNTSCLRTFWLHRGCAQIVGIYLLLVFCCSPQAAAPWISELSVLDWTEHLHALSSPYFLQTVALAMAVRFMFRKSANGVPRFWVMYGTHEDPCLSISTAW